MTTKGKPQQELVDDWNSKYPVGQKVHLKKDDGTIVVTTTKYPAEVVCGTACGWFNGIRGAYMLERATAMKEPDEWYLQDKRQYVGNDILWWKDGGGYTTSVEEAEIFTKEKAFKHHTGRETDVPWPKRYIDQRTRPVIDMQYVDNAAAMKEVE